jgi:hypothetical protein
MSKSGWVRTLIPAICSLVIPGLGQLLQGRIALGVIFFIFTVVGYFFGFFGLAPHLLACYYAAKDKEPGV